MAPPVMRVCKPGQRRHNARMGTALWALSERALSPWSRKRWRRYAREAQRPLHSLLFILPLVIVYEVFVSRAAETGQPHSLVAYGFVADLLAWIGLAGAWVPPVTLVATLILWHWRRGDRWRVRWWVLPAMVLEGAVLAVPLWVLSALFSAPPPARPLDALGAGIYEEFVFRLLLVSLLTWLLVELARLSRDVALWVAVGLAAVVFAICHFSPLGAATWSWQSLVFTLVAGFYLAVIFVGRGLGVAVGAHVAYNLLLMWVWHAGR